MSSFEEMEREARELRQEIDAILNTDRKELYGAERLGEISFERHGKEQFERIFSLFEDLKRCELNRLPTYYIQTLRQSVKMYKGFFERAKSLNMKRTDVAPAAERGQIVKDIEGNYHTLFDATLPFISTSSVAQLSGGIRKMENEAKQSLDSIREEEKKSRAASASVRGLAAKTGTDYHTNCYKEAQEKHAGNARRWLIALSLVAGLLALAAIAYFCIYYGEKGEFVLRHREVAALLIVVLLLYAIFFCAKNYASEKHNQVVSNNKTNALDTFELFVSSANSEDTKDQVLLVSAMVIFANTSTGFGKDQGMPLPPLMEAVKRGADVLKGKN